MSTYRSSCFTTLETEVVSGDVVNNVAVVVFHGDVGLHEALLELELVVVAVAHDVVAAHCGDGVLVGLAGVENLCGEENRIYFFILFFTSSVAKCGSTGSMTSSTPCNPYTLHHNTNTALIRDS